jgi:saccharopine dehydrogenase-like NADP-dependent oxidoreductase
MPQILLFGAGQSSAYLIDYLLNHSEEKNLFLTVAGNNLEEIIAKTKNHKRSKALLADVLNEQHVEALIKASDLIISLLPPAMHLNIAKKCVLHRKNMLTASYATEEMKNLHEQAQLNDIILLNEIGLDPGIDHMSAMQLFDKIKSKGGEIFSFESYCGGLIAPESDNNPWNYKFTWNPKNVVLAGQGGDAQFLENRQIKNIPYQSLFKNIRNVSIDKIGDFEGYANRDSLKYQNTYGLQNVETLIRGTLRKKGFCKAWDILIQLGLTNNEIIIPNSDDLTPFKFINLFLKESSHNSLISKIENTIELSLSEKEIKKITYLNFEGDINPIGLKNATAAQLLEFILKEKWKLSDDDKDLVVMIHQIGYTLHDKKYFTQSSLAVTGNLKPYTAMAKTVGLPLGIASLLILENKINLKGVILPIHKEIYEPILRELSDYDINFTEIEKELNA